MSLVGKTVRGAMWLSLTSFASRALGTVGTVVLTWMLAPEVMGAVTAAHILVFSCHVLTIVGFGQFVITRREEGPEAVFHATFFHLLLGALSLAAAYFLGERLGREIHAPELVIYIPGFMLATALDRVALMPESLLARDLRFGAIALARTSSELSFPLLAVGLAWSGWGGHAVVWANVGRSLVRTAGVVLPVDWRAWLLPCRLRREISVRLFRYGLPLALASICGFAARRWDNLVFSRYFGAAQMGLYNSAYNLADIPAAHVGEQIGDVLLPSFASLPPARRGPGLLRALSLLALIMFPMAAGLGAIAHTLVAVLFSPAWQGVAPLLVALSLLSVGRPLAWAVSAYLQAVGRTVAYMGLEVLKVVLLFGGLAALAGWGPLWTSAAASAAICVHAGLCIAVAAHGDGLGVPLVQFARILLGPLAACVPLVAAVLAVRHGLARAGLEARALALLAEVVAGVAGYVPAALLFARRPARDLRGVLGTLRRRGDSS